MNIPLLQREMDRKEFIIFLVVIILTITGISGLLTSTQNIINSQKKVSSGFGSNPYGK